MTGGGRIFSSILLIVRLALAHATPYKDFDIDVQQLAAVADFIID